MPAHSRHGLEGAPSSATAFRPWTLATAFRRWTLATAFRPWTLATAFRRWTLPTASRPWALAAALTACAPYAIAPDAASPADTVAPTADALALPDAPPLPALPDAIEPARSLAWTDPALLDDRAVVGLARVMRVVARDGHGGRLFDALLRRFGATAHSERAGPVQLADELASAHGADPARWDLDALPFRVTAVHNRVDLARGADCGELRVSLASTHATYHPLHVIFLFRLAPGAGDTGPAGAVHCAATAAEWARLTALAPEAFRAAARALLARALTRERFLLAESVEFTVSPWEWRQWQLAPNRDPATHAALPEVFDNVPLFQTVDTEGLNPPSPRRSAFLQWVAAHAADLDARRAEIPPEYRAPSARVTQGVPRTPLDLTGLAPDVAARYPRLRQHIEIVGCPACHTTDAPFVQTLPDRTFSPFYTRELEARAGALLERARGRASPPAPFGPLQADFALPR